MKMRWQIWSLSGILTLLIFVALPLSESVGTAPVIPEPVRSIEVMRLPDMSLQSAASVPGVVTPADFSKIPPGLPPDPVPGFEMPAPSAFPVISKRKTRWGSVPGSELAEWDFPVMGGSSLEWDHGPQLLMMVDPLYPELFRNQGLEGEVLLQARVDAQGQVHQIEILRSDLPAAFEQRAVRALSQARFRPGRQGGEAVAASVILPVRFYLEENFR
ncbi:MAG: energy transducer TonB [Candidatus Omnitrophica bacterium]|nr:energy transducer TonB [Candidatus Omnitrophota bacterium]